MAQFDNVTYTHYHDDLGRSVVPDAATFDAGKLEIILYVKSLVNDGLIVEREPGGIDDACCMMIETDYQAAQTAAGKGDAGGVMASENIGSYSYSRSTKAAEIAVEKNAKSADESRYKWLSLYCHVLTGRR